jgi:predicted metal-binding protein
MAGKMENDMKKLCDLALDSGGTAASCFEAKDVVIDERTRLKCMVPVCDDYGVNLMCPPNVMSVAEFASILSRYDVTILIQVGIAVPEKVKNMIENGDENLSELYNNKVFSDNYRQTLTKARKLLHEIVNKVESAAFSMGYNFAAGLIGGSCRLCGNCVKGAVPASLSCPAFNGSDGDRCSQNCRQRRTSLRHSAQRNSGLERTGPHRLITVFDQDTLSPLMVRLKEKHINKEFGGDKNEYKTF